MNNEIIDLTVSPAPLYIDVDAEESAAAASTLPTTTDPRSAEPERKRSRRKKRKRTLTEGESQSSATQTREHSVEEGELDSGRRRERPSNCSPVQQSERNTRRKDQRLREQDHRRRSPSPTAQKPPPSKHVGDLFFIDVEPALLPSTALLPSSIAQQEKSNNTLMLPAHVSVFGNAPVEILPPTSADSEEEDYIDYLDFGDRSKNVVRYFEEQVEESSKPSRTVCKNCGAEGEHTTASCPVLICLTCGARNEHGTRSCPISKTCFTCGMKGHVNATCPNRRAARRGELGGYDDCDRCGSGRHITNECPTLWRLYEYLTEGSKNLTLETRRQKQHLTLGEGGEGYIADDEWCYNCGSCGHWGDDCQDLPHREDIPNESSAFSEHNTLSGPFFDTVVERPTSKSRRCEPRDWELANDLPAAWGNVPENVGRQGRRNNVAKMERKAKEQAVEDDPDDWFGNVKNVRNRGVPQNNGNGNRTPAPLKKMAFGKSIQESSRQFQQPSPPSLLDRLGDNYRSNESRSRRHGSGNSRSDSQHKSDYGNKSQSRRDDRYRPERDRDRDWRRRDDSGPRYRGGYSR